MSNESVDVSNFVCEAVIEEDGKKYELMHNPKETNASKAWFKRELKSKKGDKN